MISRLPGEAMTAEVAILVRTLGASLLPIRGGCRAVLRQRLRVA